jgi:hypothetical protein
MIVIYMGWLDGDQVYPWIPIYHHEGDTSWSTNKLLLALPLCSLWGWSLFFHSRLHFEYEVLD